MQDAYNLSWKLAAVLNGHIKNPELLLRSYEVERLSVAQGVVAATDK